MEKLKMHSLNKVDDNIAKIGQLFPNSLTERKNENGEVEYAIDFDVLRQELSSVIVEGNEERYQFTWPDKKQSILLANAPIAKTLRPCPEESVDFDTTENLYIEGDNLDVLKLLQETYLGKVKMIYIDPPYNTGNDFVYEDNFAQSTEDYLSNSGQFDEEGNRLVQNNESNGRFHTDWLNMIYPRIKVAKDLLTDDGVIFISIDDNEVENLKKLCNEVFGESNFVANLVWEKKKKGSFLSNNITNIKEYLLVYAKQKQSFPGLIGEINSEEETYPCVNASNKRENRILQPGLISKFKEQNYFLPKGSVISDTTMNLVLISDLVIENGILSKALSIEGNWRYSQETMTNYAKNGEIYITRDLYLRRIVKEARYKTLKDLLPREGNNKGTGNTNLVNLFESGWGSNEDADEEQRLIFGLQKVIDYPKPVQLIYKILASYRDTEFTVIDFFSGSATTAHAVMSLNAEGGGNRKFIMVQLPEVTDEKSEAYKAGYKNICEIGKERIRRAGKKIVEEQKAKDKGLFDKEAPKLDIGFRVLKLDSTNMKDVYYNPSEYTPELFSSLTDNIKEDRTPEDLLFQVMLELGVLLSSKIEKTVMNGKMVFNVASGYLIACFDDDINDATVKAIAQQKPYYAVFRDSSMASDSVATNVEQIFATYSSTTERKVI
jgi:adenine-specific DNA-methyltransferase